MKLQLDPSPTYMLPVTIPVRLKEGPLKTVNVRLEVKRLDQDEYGDVLERFAKAIDPTLVARVADAAKQGRLKELAEQLEEEGAASEPQRPVNAMRVELRKVVEGWDQSDFDPATEFSEGAFEKLLVMPGATQAIFFALGDSIPTAKRKN